MSGLYLMVSHAGRRLGNWNDRVNGGDSVRTRQRPRAWRALDHVAASMYAIGDRAIHEPKTGSDNQATG